MNEDYLIQKDIIAFLIELIIGLPFHNFYDKAQLQQFVTKEVMKHCALNYRRKDHAPHYSDAKDYLAKVRRFSVEFDEKPELLFQPSIVRLKDK